MGFEREIEGLLGVVVFEQLGFASQQNSAAAVGELFVDVAVLLGNGERFESAIEIVLAALDFEQGV